MHMFYIFQKPKNWCDMNKHRQVYGDQTFCLEVKNSQQNMAAQTQSLKRYQWISQQYWTYWFLLVSIPEFCDTMQSRDSFLIIVTSVYRLSTSTYLSFHRTSNFLAKHPWCHTTLIHNGLEKNKTLTFMYDY